MSENNSDGYTDVTERGKYVDMRILVDELDNSYQQVGEDLKAKVWESDTGERRLYLRVRDSDDGRKFNEFSVDLGRSLHTGTEQSE